MDAVSELWFSLTAMPALLKTPLLTLPASTVPRGFDCGLFRFLAGRR